MICAPEARIVVRAMESRGAAGGAVRGADAAEGLLRRAAGGRRGRRRARPCSPRPRHAPGEIDVELIAPALWRVGELWEQGEINVADEHPATEITVRVLVLQREALRDDAAARAGGSCRRARGRAHVVGLRMAADLLPAAGSTPASSAPTFRSARSATRPSATPRTSSA